MKGVLPGLTLLLGIAAVLVRRGSASEPEFQAPRSVPSSAVATSSPSMDAKVEVRVRATESVRSLTPPEAREVVKTGPSPIATPWALLGALDRKLRLTDFQKRQAEEIFRERNLKVEDYGIEVARRGWAQLKDFDLRVGGLREDSYRRFAAILDAAQAVEFARQVAVGIPEDHLSIEIPDGLVVLD